MSKTHIDDNQDDLDAQLDQFIKTKKVQPAVQQSASEPIDLFGSGPEKKKTFLQRLRSLILSFLRPRETAV